MKESLTILVLCPVRPRYLEAVEEVNMIFAGFPSKTPEKTVFPRSVP